MWELGTERSRTGLSAQLLERLPATHKALGLGAALHSVLAQASITALGDTGRKTRRSRPSLAVFTVSLATGCYLSEDGMGISEMAEPEKVPIATKPDNLSLVPGPPYEGRRGTDSCQLSFDLHPRVMHQPPTN